MIKVLAVVFAVAFSLGAVSTANAEGGCGWGWHRGPFGGCRPNGSGPVVVAAPGPGVVVVNPGGGRVCPYGYHLGPYGHCRPNY